MTIDLKGRTHLSKDSLYELRSGRVHYNFYEDIITIDSFQLIPRYDEKNFFKKAHFQTDRMTIISQEISLHDFRFEELIIKDHIHFGRIDVEGIHAEMTRDKRYPRKPDDYKLMPQQMLRDMKQKITIDSII